VFKHINSSDVIVIPYIANKQYIISSSSLNEYGIEIYSGKNISGSLFTTTTSSLSSSISTTYSSSILYNSTSFVNSWETGSIPGSPGINYNVLRYYFSSSYNLNTITSSLIFNIPSSSSLFTFLLMYISGSTNTIIDSDGVTSGSAGTYNYVSYNSYNSISNGGQYALFFTGSGITGVPTASVLYTYSEGSSSISTFSSSVEPEFNGQYERLIYNQFKHLYYSNYVYDQLITGSRFTSATSSYDNFDMTTCASGSGAQVIKYFPTESNARVSAISIPQNLFGSSIKPGTFNIVMDQTTILFDAFESRVIADGGTFEADEWAIETIAELLGEEIELNVVDDYEGNLFANSNYVGNIIYPHGLVIFTSGSIVNYITGSDFTLSFKNEHIIYENEITCTVNEDEFNLSYNPTLLIDLSGSLQNFATSSQVNPYVVTQSGYFNPYVTTVGLYNDANELLAVAKMAQPVPLSSNTDTVFKIKYDR